jgi:hypothetical protein
VKVPSRGTDGPPVALIIDHGASRSAPAGGALAAEGAALVLPPDDQQLIGLSLRRAEISALVPYAAHESVLRATDKLELHRAAGRADLGTLRPSGPPKRPSARWAGPRSSSRDCSSRCPE